MRDNCITSHKKYCLLSLLYGCEVWHKISVAWNNCFRRIFSCCWRKSVKPLQYYCSSLPILHIIQQRKLLFGKRFTGQIIVLLTLPRLTYNAFIAVRCTFGVLCSHRSYQTIQSKDLYGTHLPHHWNCNCFLCVYFLVCYTV